MRLRLGSISHHLHKKLYAQSGPLRTMDPEGLHPLHSYVIGGVNNPGDVWIEKPHFRLMNCMPAPARKKFNLYSIVT
jgi:hypothetical protein